MNHTFRFLALFAGAILFGTIELAGAVPVPLGNGITVDCQMSDASPCVLVGVNPRKWAIAEPANDTVVEPGIALFFNVPFLNPGAINILDPDGTTVSDQVSFLNFVQNNNNGVLDFFSDPNNNIVPGNFPTGCTEDAVAGCSFNFTVATTLGTLFFSVSSDADLTNSVGSDTISVAVPEPSSWLLVGIGIIGLLVLGRRRRGALSCMSV